MAKAHERRAIQRFKFGAPLTIILGDREIPAYIRDLSNRGMYFYLSTADSVFIDRDFEFLVELPPDITLSTCCWIRGHARALRVEETSNEMIRIGVAAEIVDYSILKNASVASLQSN